jgi:hypothetical protein
MLLLNVFHELLASGIDVDQLLHVNGESLIDDLSQFSRQGLSGTNSIDF